MAAGGGRLALLVALVVGCGGKARPATTTPTVIAVPAPTIKVGDCGDPERDGVVSASPQLVRDQDRDLDGDGRPEVVVADRAMCTPAGNCYWNVFLAPADGCARFVGTLAGAKLEPRSPATVGALGAVRAYWSLGGPRILVQTYEHRRGGYLLSDTLLCRREDDDRLSCTEDLR